MSEGLPGPNAEPPAHRSVRCHWNKAESSQERWGQTRLEEGWRAGGLNPGCTGESSATSPGTGWAQAAGQWSHTTGESGRGDAGHSFSGRRCCAARGRHRSGPAEEGRAGRERRWSPGGARSELGPEPGPEPGLGAQPRSRQPCPGGWGCALSSTPQGRHHITLGYGVCVCVCVKPIATCPTLCS